jgi:hypothetical protein
VIPAISEYESEPNPDRYREQFDRAVRSEAFAASGKDALAMGIPFTVHFASLE